MDEDRQILSLIVANMFYCLAQDDFLVHGFYELFNLWAKNILKIREAIVLVKLDVVYHPSHSFGLSFFY